MKTIWAILAGAAVVAAVLAAGLVSGSGVKPHDQLRIAYFANIGHAVPIVGMEKGFFEDGIPNGTRIVPRVFDSGPQAIESMFAGSIDMAYVGPGPAINGHLNSPDNNIVILAGAASGGTSFVIHPDSGIESPADLAGKRIASPQIGNTQDVSLRHYISEHGLKTAERGGSVTVYNLPNPDIYTLFAKGDIDGAWVAEPWATILESELGGKRLFHEEELWPDGRFASVLLIGNTGYVEANPQAVSDLVAAHEKTVEWINQNPEETGDIFNGFMDSHLGGTIPDDIVDMALSNLEITSDPVPESVHSFASRADALGYLGRGGYDISQIFYGGIT